MKTPTEELESPYLDGELEFVVPANKWSHNLAHAIDESPFAIFVDLRGAAAQPETDELQDRDEEWEDRFDLVSGLTNEDGEVSEEAMVEGDARWAADVDSPDHRHLLPDSFSIVPFSFTPANLEKLCALNRFQVPADATSVLFGLRACTLDGDSLSSGWTTSAQLAEATPNHAEARCVLGVWDRPGSRIIVFKGSTVPYWKSMENYRQGGERCNLLSTGLYGYKVGTHRSGHRLEIKGAFRQLGPVVVLRTVDDLVYQVSDPWDSGHVGDNIHPARRMGTTGFSSEGCFTIPGKYDKATRKHSGSWTDFREAAGLTPTSAPAAENGRRFVFVLLTGREARLVGHLIDSTVALSRLRFGSRGTDVTALQLGLSSTGQYRGSATGVMDVDTTLAYIRWQQSVDGGRADAIVTPNDGRALGFDMIRGVSIAPAPWRRGATPVWDYKGTPGTSSGSGSAAAAAGHPRFMLASSVGIGGKNAATDVAALKDRLIALGYDWVKPGSTVGNDTKSAIKLFQSIIAGRHTLGGDGRVDVPGRTFEWLQAVNAPRWQTMPAGSAAEGFYNVELANTVDQHDYGTNWIADVIRTAGAHYRDNYLNSNASAALLTVNDVSLPQGGYTEDHTGHQTGLACDLRLPRLDGTAPGDTTWNGKNKSLYDRNAGRGVIQALRAQSLVSQVYFNDDVLIGEGLCQHLAEHDNHIHFQISPPARGAVEMVPSGGVQPEVHQIAVSEDRYDQSRHFHSELSEQDEYTADDEAEDVELEDEVVFTDAEEYEDESDRFESFAPKVSLSDLRTRIDDYCDKANVEYDLGGGAKVKARPQFRYAKAGGTEEAIVKVKGILGPQFEKEHPRAIRNAAYGKAKPSEVAAITQGLIDAGKLEAIRKDHTGLPDDQLVRKLQHEFKMGIDCTGYVQLAFIYAFIGNDNDTKKVRKSLGLHERRGYEKLASLPSSHFKKVAVTDAQTGDLFVMKPRADSDDRAWHTVIVVDRTVTGTVHTFLVDASWGTDLYGEAAGGVARRELKHDTSTGEWWDIHPLDGSKAHENSTGPYNEHPIYGIYRAKQKK